MKVLKKEGNINKYNIAPHHLIFSGLLLALKIEFRDPQFISFAQ
jgi:hypothetical protein